MHKSLLTLPCCLLALACAGNPAPTAEHEDAERAASAPDVTDAPDASAVAAELRPLLLARHAEDVPERATLERHPHADAGLRWLAENDTMLLVRSRALLLLRHYPSAASETVVVATLDDEQAHVKLRAAAMQALTGWDLEAREDLRERAIDAVRSPELPLAVAAARVLVDVEAASQIRTSYLDDDSLPAPVHRALK